MAADPRGPFNLSPSVGAWLQRAPQNARLKLNEMVTQEPSKAEDDLGFRFNLSPSVGAWLRAAPKGAHQELMRLGGSEATTLVDGTPVADAIEIEEQPAVPKAPTPFNLTPSVGGWLQSRPVRTTLASAVAAAATEEVQEPQEVFDEIQALFTKEAERDVPSPRSDLREPRADLRGDFRSVPPTFFNNLYAMFPKVQQSQPISELTRPSSRQRPENARFMTNSTATREQVVNFAQSLTSSIFRNSNTLAMQRASSQPLFRQPATFTAPTRATSSRPVVAAPQVTLPRPHPGDTLRRPIKRLQPIPAEEGAFFD